MSASARLKNEITALRAKIKTTESRADNWLKLTEQTFEFACAMHIKHFYSEMQKPNEEVATISGLNCTLKDHLLNIHAVEWLVPIKERYPVLEAKFKALEPTKIHDLQGRNEVLAPLRPEMRACLDDVCTILIRIMHIKFSLVEKVFYITQNSIAVLKLIFRYSEYRPCLNK